MNRSRLLRWSMLLLVAFLVVLGRARHNQTPLEITSIVEAAPIPKEKYLGGKSDWVMDGGTPQRNMVNHTDKNLKIPFDPKDDLKWKVDTARHAHGGPVISQGRIFVGTNNVWPRNQRDAIVRGGESTPIDKGILLCLKERDGDFLWQGVHDKTESIFDWPAVGITSTPVVEGNRLYYVSNRCELVCADLGGFADGNQGNDKEQYQTETDVDIIWKIDLIKEYKVHPHNTSPCSPLIVDDLVFIVTSNGVEETHTKVASPDAPSFMAVNKITGKVKWTSNLPGKNILHGQWSSPAYAMINRRPQVIFPGGDGWLYSFDPPTGKLLWKFDANPKNSKWSISGSGTRSDFIGMPVIYKDRIYIGTGQDPEHFEGVGYFHCIDPTKNGDISAELVTDATTDPPKTKPNPNSGVVWTFGGFEDRPHLLRDYKFGRTMSTACIVDDIIYIPEISGYLHCLDAKTGKQFWVYDVRSSIWGSAYYVDGKILLGNEDGDLFVFKHDPKPDTIDCSEKMSKAYIQAEKKALAAGFDKKMAAHAGYKAVKQIEKTEAYQPITEKYLLAKIEIEEPIYRPVIVANGVLYVQTQKTLYAFRVAKE